MELQEIQRLFPSEDGNKEQQQYLLDLRNRLIKEVDSYKNPNKSILGKQRTEMMIFIGS